MPRTHAILATNLYKRERNCENATAPKPKKVVLAYSGGLDTSIIIPWLKENYGCEVIAMIGDVGQQEDLEAARKKALATGASTAYVEDLREEFIRDYIWPTLRAGAVYEHTYLLGTSMARPVIAKRQAELALKLGADGLSHGCTGKGNDQVRFELAYKAIAPNVQIIAPWREWDIDSREDAIAYAEKHNVPSRAEQEKYLQPRPQHLAPQPRRRRTRRSRQRAERSHVAVDRLAGKSSGQSRRSRDRFRSRHAGFRERRKARSGRLAQHAERNRRAPRRRPHRPRRKSPGRHEVARRVRNSRRHAAGHRASRTRNA